ncbi:hypothetical protein KQX54_018007 [Cotesia glomerata]|uniref:Uncharacterized protein n=1 Tax=Cotesia glomerata TaxID=32391 RepID=A0AAV7J9Z3_COTGL|nr:hypothetical protein KQX54_018007 [Cotesia glomerata]
MYMQFSLDYRCIIQLINCLECSYGISDVLEPRGKTEWHSKQFSSTTPYLCLSPFHFSREFSRASGELSKLLGSDVEATIGEKRTRWYYALVLYDIHDAKRKGNERVLKGE